LPILAQDGACVILGNVATLPRALMVQVAPVLRRCYRFSEDEYERW
jgi:hypothetical protein